MERDDRDEGVYSELDAMTTTTQTERQLQLSMFAEGFRTAVTLRGAKPRTMPADPHWNAGWDAGRDVFVAALTQYSAMLGAK